MRGTTAFLKLNTALQLSWSQKGRHVLETAPVLLHRNDAGEKIEADAISENQNLQCSFSLRLLLCRAQPKQSSLPWALDSLQPNRRKITTSIRYFFSVSGKPGKYSFQASNTSSWQAYLAGSRHWSKHALFCEIHQSRADPCPASQESLRSQLWPFNVRVLNSQKNGIAWKELPLSYDK